MRLLDLKFVKIGLETYEVIREEEMEVAGSCNEVDKVLKIEEGTKEEMLEILLHEMFHGILHEYGFTQTTISDDLWEALAEVQSKVYARLLLPFV